MPQRKILLPILLLQFIPLLIFPPATLQGAFVAIALVLLVFAGLGLGVWRGRSWALTLSIFLQGVNIIVRLMMLFPNAKTEAGVVNLPFILTSLLAIIVSGWFLLRLDRPDIRALIVA